MDIVSPYDRVARSRAAESFAAAYASAAQCMFHVLSKTAKCMADIYGD